MKSLVIVFSLIICLVTPLVGATEIGPGDVSGDWYSSGNPYNINGEITVPAGETLQINEDVEVVFQGHYKLIVNGYLEAVGTEASPILFTAANTVEGWHSIRFIDAPDTSHLTWCIIEYGRAVGTENNDPDGWGGGALCYNSSPEISHCTFRENSTNWHGGGIFYYASNTEITDSIFNGNNAYDGGAGFAYISNLVIRDCEIIDNVAEVSTGGFELQDSTTTVEYCTISGNYSGSFGGGMGGVWGGHLTIRHCTITGNVAADWGGGVAGDGGSGTELTMTITGNVIEGNYAGYRGGGVYAFRNCTGTIANNIICENEADLGGGGITLWLSCTMEMLNNLVIDNLSNGGGAQGGGILCMTGCTASLRNMTVYGNSATQNGGGIAVVGGSSATLMNNILWDNDAPTGSAGYIGSTDSLTISYSDVEGGQASVYKEPGSALDWGGGMIDTDPLFFDPDFGDYHLCQDPCQPGVVNDCVDAGHPFSPMIAGTTRTDCFFDEDRLDMGYHYTLVDTVTADLGCVPDSGLLPFAAQFSVTLGNAVAYDRTIAGRIDLTLAGGATYQSWRAGYTNLGPNEMFVTSWQQTLPALGSLVGANVFVLYAEDVTPPPYNQPPYPPAGDTDTCTVTVTAMTP